MTHQLKCITQSFNAMADGSKPFSVRKNDRNFQVGDLLDLHEWTGENYTGFGITVRVTCVCSFAQRNGYVVLGVKPHAPPPEPPRQRDLTQHPHY